MRHIVTTLLFLSVSFSRVPLLGQVSSGTGASEARWFNDENSKIVLATLSDHQTARFANTASPCTSSPSPATIETNLSGWAPELPGTRWIGPPADQSKSLRNRSCAGSITNETQLRATPALTLNARVLADHNVVVRFPIIDVRTRNRGAATVRFSNLLSGTPRLASRRSWS